MQNVASRYIEIACGDHDEIKMLNLLKMQLFDLFG